MEQTNYKRNMAYVQYLLRYMLMAGGKMYTVDDILALPDGERAELIDGEMFMMATPTTAHQESSMWLSMQVFNYIQHNKGKCRVIQAPFGVFIKKDDKNYLEPDISVICNRDKLDNKGCHGAPDWVIEIVSPSSKDMDYRRKLKVNKIAARWPAKAVAQFSTFSKKAVTGLSQDSIVKVRTITNIKHGRSPNNCL